MTSTINEEDPCLSISSSTSSAATLIHCNIAAEQEATNDGGSIQNNTTTTTQSNNTTTPSPSQQPSSVVVTPRPTRNERIPFALSGTLYYDLNANARRESNIAALLGEKRYLGRDVEYSVGLGGVTVQLVECRDDDYGGGGEAESSSTATDNDVEETTQVVTAVTIGVDVQGRPNLVLSGGDYNLVDIKVDRSYYINVKAPTGYLLTGGICNDELLGGRQQHQQQQWACGKHNNGVVGTNYYGEDVAEWIPQQQQQQQQPQPLEVALWQHNETNLGIAEGRSSKCVSVDKAGLTDSTLDIGVMRLGDVTTFVVGYHVVLDRDVDTMTSSVDTFDDMNNLILSRRRRRRSMQKEVMMMMEQPSSLSTEDLDAIRNVVTEIFAVNLQRALMQRDLSFVQIDQVLSLDVQYHIIRNATAITDEGVDANENEDAANNNLFDDTEIDTTVNVGTTRNIFKKTQSNGKGDKEDFFSTYSLSVDIIVKGHYRKDMDVNIRDGANTTTIEELLRNEMSGNTTQDELLLQDLLEYNPKCLEQMSKMKEPAFTLDGYSEVYSSKGILKLTSSPSHDDAANSTGSTVFSAACANGNVLGFLMTDADEVEEEAVVVNSTKVEEGQGALGKVAASTMEDPGFPWLPILIALVCGLVGLGLVVFLVRRRRRRRATEKEGCDVGGASDAPSECKSPSGNERDKGGPMGTLLGLVYKNKTRVASKTAEFADIEAGLESGGELDDNDKPSTTADVSPEEESGKESSHQEGKHSGDDESKIVDQPYDKEAVKTEVSRPEKAEAKASNLEAPATSLTLDGSEESEKKPRRRRRQHRKKSNSDYANEPSQCKQHDTLRRSICDIDIGTVRMKVSRELSALELGGATTSLVAVAPAVAAPEQDKKRSRRGRYTSNSQLSELDKSYERRRLRVAEIHQNEAYFAAESRRRGRKHNPLRQSIDDSNIGLRSRATISTLNNTPKEARRKSRKPDTLRKSQDDSNLGLRTAGAAAANVTLNDPPKGRRKKSRKPDPSGDCSNIDRKAAGAANTTSNDAPKERRRKSRKSDSLRKSQDDSNIGLRTAGAAAAAAAANKDAKKTSRKKSRKIDPLRSSQDDSNVGLRTARKKASKSEQSQNKRKKGRRQDPLRLSRCDVDIGTKRQPENLMALKDLSSKSGRYKHDRGTKDETDKRPSVKRSLSK